MARPSNTAARQAQITRALRKVMAQHGYDGASIADIAKAARLTPGLVHYHFENKQQILLAALKELVVEHEARLAAKLSQSNGDAHVELGLFVDFHLGLGADADAEALACWILLSGEALREFKVRVEFERALQAMANRLTELILRGVTQRVFVCDAPEAAASALLATVQGYFVLVASARSVIPKGSAATATKRMAQGLLGAAPFVVREQKS